MAEALQYDVVIVGGGAAGIATAASILRRATHLSVAIVEPADTHEIYSSKCSCWHRY